MRTRTYRLPSAALLFCAAVAVLLLPGCGGGKVTVTGKVSYAGTPLKGGFVTFVAQDGGPNYTGTIQDDGSYSVDVLTGKYKVCVDTEGLKPGGADGGPKTGPSGMSSASGKPGMGPGGVGGPPPGVMAGFKSTTAADLQKNAESGKLKNAPPGSLPEGAGGYKDGFATTKDNSSKYIAIPTKYAKAETTDLTVEIKGSQTYDIALAK